jgi:hypothetical protein
MMEGYGSGMSNTYLAGSTTLVKALFILSQQAKKYFNLSVPLHSTIYNLHVWTFGTGGTSVTFEISVGSPTFLILGRIKPLKGY